MIRSFLTVAQKVHQRPSTTEWGFAVALAVSTRGECLRRRVGAIIVDRKGRIAGAGYNGSYPGGPSCLKGQCPRGSSSVEPGSSYDTGPGACHAIHAELNALLDVSDKNRLVGAQMYITTDPCDGCLKILRSTSIRQVRWIDADGCRHSLVHPFERS